MINTGNKTVQHKAPIIRTVLFCKKSLTGSTGGPYITGTISMGPPYKGCIGAASIFDNGDKIGERAINIDGMTCFIKDSHRISLTHSFKISKDGSVPCDFVL